MAIQKKIMQELKRYCLLFINVSCSLIKMQNYVRKVMIIKVFVRNLYLSPSIPSSVLASVCLLCLGILSIYLTF